MAKSWDELDKEYAAGHGVYAPSGDAWDDLDKKYAAPAQAPAPKKPKIAPVKDLPKYNQTDGMSTTDRTLAGVGKAIYDAGRGIGNLVGLVSDSDIAESRRLDKALMDTRSGFLGNIAGNVGMALLPGGALKGAGVAAKSLSGVRALSSLPKVQAALSAAAPALSSAGGTLIAPKSISSALGVGAGMGAIQPAESIGERALNIGIGAGSSALVPVGVRAYQTGKSLLEPFTQKGREKIVGRAIQAAAGNDGPKLTETIRQATLPFTGPMPQGYVVPQMVGEVVPGSVPTVGQLAMRTQTPSIAAMERAATQTDPIVMNAAKVRIDDQNEARRQLLAAMAGTEGQRESALDAANKSAKSLYGAAFKEQMPVTPELVKLANRPSMRMAEARAAKLGEEIGAPFQATLDDLRPKYVGIPGKESSAVVQPKLTASQQYLGVPQPDVQMQFAPQVSSYLEIPPVDSLPVRDMHTLKMGMDAMMGDHTLGIGGREAVAINATRNKLVDLMPESYQKARLSHIEMNRPVHQMEIADELLNKSTSPLDGRFYPQKFATALDDTRMAARATGLKGATLEGTMSNSQMNALNGLKEDLQTQAFAGGAGKAGSDTVQKLAYSNMINQAGVPNWLRNFGGSQLVGGLIGRTGDLAYANANKQLSGLLGETLLDPQTTLKMLTVAQENDEVLRRLARSGSALGLMAPGLLNGGQQ